MYLFISVAGVLFTQKHTIKALSKYFFQVNLP